MFNLSPIWWSYSDGDILYSEVLQAVTYHFVCKQFSDDSIKLVYLELSAIILPLIAKWPGNYHLYKNNSYSLQTLTALKNLYNNDVDQVELFVGGMLLSAQSGDMANIFKKILAEQIIRLREGDRWVWKGIKAFSPAKNDSIVYLSRFLRKPLFVK